MANVTIDTVFRSLGTAAILALNQNDPEADFSLLDNLTRFEGRAGVTFDNQDHPMTYGPLGTFLVPGVVVEYGEITNYMGKCRCGVILSVSRTIRDHIEREMSSLYQLCSRLNELIYKTESCPIYNFEANDDEVTDKSGRLLWHFRTLNNPRPTERLIQNPELGGWMRNEYRFTVNFTIDSGPL